MHSASVQPAAQADGTLFVIVGPSGAGKDSLIAYAREKLADDQSVLFIRRVVTRPALAHAEDHDTLTFDAFEQARLAGAFAVHWDAHGLRYGIPVEAAHDLAGGRVAVVNGSRATLPAIHSAFGHVVTVHVTCRPEILAARLAGRGRESEADLLRRLERASIHADFPGITVEIDNSGDLAAAGDMLVGILRRATT